MIGEQVEVCHAATEGALGDVVEWTTMLEHQLPRTVGFFVGLTNEQGTFLFHPRQ